MLLKGTMTFNGALREFAQDLTPNREDTIQVSQTIDDVLQKISDHFEEGSFDRITPSGRTPKKTAVSGMVAIDIYIYINNRHPPFIRENLQLNAVISLFDENSKATEAGIFFKYKKVNFALMLARNFLPSNFTNPDQDVSRESEVQHANALKHLQSVSEDKRPLYITSLSCTSVLFGEKRDAFSHSLSRLAKYWFSQHRNADRVVDGLRIMEYLGARAAEEERITGDLAKGFSRFLTMMTLPEQIAVFWMEYYDSCDIPGSIKSQRPLLLDPCNPLNNMLAYGHNIYYICSMKGYAKATLQRLDNAEIDFKKSGRLKSFKEVFAQESSWCRFL